MVASDDKNLKEHPEVKDVSNLAVLKLMESLTSRQLVRHQYAWKHHYWFLQADGITYLREFLNLPDYCVPATHKKQAPRAPARPLGGDDRGFGGRRDGPSGPPRDGGFGRGGGDRGGYRDRKEPSSFGGERPSFGRGREGGGGGDRGGRPSFGRGAPPS
jgi:small subunit ribosomal protein S10e